VPRLTEVASAPGSGSETGSGAEESTGRVRRLSVDEKELTLKRDEAKNIEVQKLTEENSKLLAETLLLKDQLEHQKNENLSVMKRLKSKEKAMKKLLEDYERLFGENTATIDENQQYVENEKKLIEALTTLDAENALLAETIEKYVDFKAENEKLEQVNASQKKKISDLAQSIAALV